MTQDILNADTLLDTFKSMNSDYITSDDFKDTTFKGFFTSDINRPSLDNHVFQRVDDHVTCYLERHLILSLPHTIEPE